MENNPIISVSDLVSWMYCQRKFYLTKVLKIKEPLTRQMLLGKMKHNIIEFFSKKEKQVIEKIDSDLEKIDLAIIYSNLLKELTEITYQNNKEILQSFQITQEEIEKKVLKDFSQDINIRIKEIKKKTSLGLFKQELWNNLESVYVSELKVESANLGLRGRVDRIEIFKIDNAIIPYELKTRENEIFPSDEVQLTAYAMLLEELYKKPIIKGYIESGTNKQEIIITEEKKQKVIKIRQEILSALKGLPPAMLSNFNKCRSCSLRETCPNI